MTTGQHAALARLYWRLFVIRLSLRWMLNYNLGDLVWYGGEQWTLVQGVCAPRWTLQKGNDRVEAYQTAFRKVRSLSNYWRSFVWGYKFYMQNWYDIWLREGIKPWMRGCNIWGRKP